MKNTIKQNKLLAEFLEYKNITPEDRDFNIYEGDALIINGETKKLIEAMSMEFSTNWNWLIIVIKKIRNIVNTELSINEFDKFRYLEQRLNPYNYEIDSVFNGCIEFIKWYNENNK